jgi:hypothetical protein
MRHANPKPVVAHHFWIEVKKLRYEAEVVQPVWPRPVNTLLARLAPLQKAPGDVHDVDVRLSRLKKLSRATQADRAALNHLRTRVRTGRRNLVRNVRRVVGLWRRKPTATLLRWQFSTQGALTVLMVGSAVPMRSERSRGVRHQPPGDESGRGRDLRGTVSHRPGRGRNWRSASGPRYARQLGT